MSRSSPVTHFAMPIWEILLGAASFLFYRIVRFGMRVLVSLHYIARPEQRYVWNFASAQKLRQPGVLPVIMTTGPRWNTHAIVATSGPFPVKEKLSIAIESADCSAGHWTIVVCRMPGYRTAAVFSSLHQRHSGNRELTLSPGRYWLGLRYYRYLSRIELPTVLIDGAPRIAATAVPSNVNTMYETLADKTTFFYVALNYHAYVLLKYRRLFAASFVDKVFLPLGNPETQFYYGWLPRGASLTVNLETALLDSCHVYLTVYNRASFPTASYEFQSRTQTVCTSVEGYYLMRVHQNRAPDKVFDREWVQIAMHARTSAD